MARPRGCTGSRAPRTRVQARSAVCSGAAAQHPGLAGAGGWLRERVQYGVVCREWERAASREGRGKMEVYDVDET